MLGPHSIDVLRVGESSGKDDYGNDTAGADVEFTVTGCSVQPGAGGEFDDQREATTTLFTVWAPLDPRVFDTDRIRYDGTVYAVDGQVARWDFTPGHQVIRLKAVSG